MIPVDQPDILDGALKILASFATGSSVRGRFVCLYLGLRRMRAEQGSGLAELGSNHVTPASVIEQYLDRLYTKMHREQPLVVLTSPFGGSASPYSAPSGIKVAGRRFPTNTWRNNFGIQKGVGCPAEPHVIEDLLNDPQRRLSCPHMTHDPKRGHVCSIRDTEYRGEEHAIWLRSDDGYQVVDLNHPAVFHDYLQPTDHPIPIFPLIGMLYCMADSGVFPKRFHVGIPEFATDFGFTSKQVSSFFDCDPESDFNTAMMSKVEDSHVLVAESSADAAGGEVVAPQLPSIPPDAMLNTGVGAELIIAKDLQSCGWNVCYRANQPGLGYDLEATRDGQTLCIEVKSSVSFANLELRASEWSAAQLYGDRYVLAVVDFYGSAAPSIWYVRNPAANVVPDQHTNITFRFVRADVEPLRTDVDFL